MFYPNEKQIFGCADTVLCADAINHIIRFYQQAIAQIESEHASEKQSNCDIRYIPAHSTKRS